ncbi:DUF6042 family protein [Streptomyces werraensis]|uniref:DUF6042 family protein n=1 Tax=Streptomyces werraensis TaxID=68284 RepID=UPI0033AAEDEB
MKTAHRTLRSMPAVLPLPGDLLPLDTDLTQQLDRIRWTMRTGPLVDILIDHLSDGLGEPQEVLISLDRLAAATGQDADDVRLARNSRSPVTHGSIVARSRPSWNVWRRTSASAWSWTGSTFTGPGCS